MCESNKHKGSNNTSEDIHLDQMRNVSCHCYVIIALLNCTYVANKKPHQIKIIGIGPKTAVI